MLRPIRRLLPLLALFSALPLAAQSWTGSAGLEVRAEDPKGHSVAGAEVVLRYLDETGAGGPAPVTTDGRGRAAVGGLAAGLWGVEVSKAGLMTFHAEVRLTRDGKPRIENASQQNVPGAVGPMRVRLARARNAPPAQPLALAQTGIAPTPSAAQTPPPPAPVAAAPVEATPAPVVEKAPAKEPAAPAPVAAAPVEATPAPVVEKVPAKEPAAPAPVAAAPVEAAPAPVVEKAPAKEPAAPAPVVAAPVEAAPAPVVEKAPAKEPAAPAPVAAAPVEAAPAPKPPSRPPVDTARTAPSSPAAKPAPAATPGPPAPPAGPRSPAPGPHSAQVSSAPPETVTVPAPSPRSLPPTISTASAPPAAAPAPAPAAPEPAAAPAAAPAPRPVEPEVEPLAGGGQQVTVRLPTGGSGCPSGLSARLGLIPLAVYPQLLKSLPPGCAVLRVDLAAGAHLADVRLAAAGAGESVACAAGKECPAGSCFFLSAPVVRRLPDSTVVLVAFESTATSPRAATLAVTTGP
jgi:hypothetical protein